MIERVKTKLLPTKIWYATNLSLKKNGKRFG
jgi:hypothetical protein